MPTYDYKCTKCGSDHEIFHSMNDAPKRECPKCGESALEKQISSGGGIIFKGSGFYETDYKRSGGGEKAESASASEKSGGCGSGCACH